ncbi:hypothetical protein V6N13_011552 [Hibiscus sabdariffa]|uniref:Myb/SANT-like DNA-binding domain-containing protein n=1 Tax=Hibiscus sabdariffa TaxID=183260 RepID=A0ABR2SCI9_9ROSI
MEALQNLTEKQSKTTASFDSENHNEKANGWHKAEVSKLIQLITAMEPRFQQGGYSVEIVLCEEIVAKMGCLGFKRSGSMCKNKWDILKKTKDMIGNKKKNGRRIQEDTIIISSKMSRCTVLKDSRH